MPVCEVIIRTERTTGGATTTALLTHAWVYWREGATTTVLRTNHEGRLMSLRSGDATVSTNYSQRFTTNTGTNVRLFHSRAVVPVPNARLSDPPDVFAARTVALPTPAPNAGTTVPVAPNSPNTVVVTPTAEIRIPAMPIALTRPAEQSLWPLLWQPYTDAYSTAGVNQGAALWAGGNLTVTENGAPPALPAASRVRERGLSVAGSIDAAATGATIQVLDTNGNVVNQHNNATTVAATLQAPTGADRGLEASVYFVDPVNAFGPAHLIVRSDGVTPPLMAHFTCYLVGVQIALVADDAGGQNAGAVKTEADEVAIVDFLNSPQPNVAAISAQGRGRRMVPYDIAAARQRPIAGINATVPEMPLWMAELHLIGIDRTDVENLLTRRRLLTPPGPQDLRLALNWNLRLSWDGPDSGTTGPGSNRRYQYNQSFTQAQQVRIALNASDQLDGVTNDKIPGALTPAPTVIPYPVANRRLPSVTVNGQSRAWGRQAGAASKKTLLVEWQPRIEDGGREIMRGGDGKLELSSLSVDGARVHSGVLANAGTPAPASPPAAPDALLPVFRVRGRNPPAAQITQAGGLIDALVTEYVNAHAAVPSVAILPVAVWQETARLIVDHEAGEQFDGRGAGRRRFGGQYYGHEGDMPKFGAPHGYGYGQHDNPPVSNDGAWSFAENLRETVRRIIEDKGGAAYTLISQHLPNPLDRRIRAVFRRETVRRYNGGTEFVWNAPAAAWVIQPSLAQMANNAPNPRLPYCNNVLGTNVVYWNGAGATATFPWPITFTTNDFGPGI